MMKSAKIAVDCCGEIQRMIWPLKAGFLCQSEGIFKQDREEVLILKQVGLVFFTNTMKCEFQVF